MFALTLAFGGIMITNNLFGFTGISAFARYVVAPLIILWIAYLVIKGVVTDASALAGTPPGSGLPFWVAVTSVIGFSMWGNEPDVWRYGKPRFWWPLPSFLFAGFWFVLFVVGGWMMAQLADSSDFGAQVKFITSYSLFGAFWLAWVLATVSQFAINDGNFYESINAGQNLIGAWHRWRRLYTCLILAVGGVVAAWLVNFHFLDGGFKVAGSVNLPAVVALLASVAFGVIGLADLPGGWIYSSPPNGWGPVPVEAWALSGVLYLAGVAVARKLAADVHAALGFARFIGPDQAAAGVAVDAATTGGGR